LADVNFNADVIDGWVPDQVVHFTGYCNMSNVTAWQWSFGDGEGSYDQNPYHTYMAPGSYTVILSVFTTNGVKTKTKENYINIRYCPGNVMDNEGNVYETVGIGSYCWMKENLNMGIRINGTDDQTDNNINEKFCYDDNEANCDIYGGLYQFDEAMLYNSGGMNQGLCPEGWHISNETEWNNLVYSQGGSNVAGESLKSTSGWFNNGNGTNSSEFTALPAGYRGYYGGFYSKGNEGIFRLSEFAPHFQNGSRKLRDDGDYVSGWYTGSINGFSVRCVKDVTME